MSETQALSFEILSDPQYTDILFGGSAGGGKSFFVCMWAVLECRNYPGISIGLGRKSLKRLRQTTLQTLLQKVHPLFGVVEGRDFKFNGQDNYIQYSNGSKIILIDMASAPTDPDYDKFGSMELTHVIIEEVGEAIKKGVDVLTSRKNRMMNAEYGIVGKTVMTCNPTQNFIRQEYYKIYEQMGGGRYQKWAKGEVIIPGTGERKEAYRAYVRSSVYDNPKVPENYIETLKNLDQQERKRLLDGDWNYADEDDTLFPSILLDRATYYETSAEEKQEKEDKPRTFNKWIGVDVADKGKDETVVSLIVDGVIVLQKELKLPARVIEPGQPVEDERPISFLYADELIKFAQQNGFTAAEAKHIAIEGNGIGVGMRDQLRIRGWYISLYEATTRSRSWGYYNFRNDMDQGLIKIKFDIDDGELRRQLSAHTYIMEEQVPKVLKKDKIKDVIGHSPDQADSAMIANWVRRGGKQAEQNSSKKNAKRIVF